MSRAVYAARTMRLLDRYLFRELLTPLAYCLGGFLIFWISFDLFTELPELQDRKLHLLDIIAYVAAMTPEFLVIVLPIVLLLALLYTLANHARHNEITAMRAAGVSLWRLCAPYFAAGIIASLALFALNELVVPHSTDWAWQIKCRYVHMPDDNVTSQFHGFINAREHRLWQFDEYHVQIAEMINPKASWTLPDGSWRQVQAERACFTNRTWTLFNAKEYAQPATNDDLVPILETNVLVMPEFDETPKQIRSEIKISGYLSLRGPRKPDISLAEIYDYLQLHPDLPHDQAARLLTQLHGRLAAPWTCLVVVIIAIPFGAVPGRRNLFFGVAGGIFICFTFFVVQSVGLALGQGGHLHAWLAAWLPNLIFAAAGLALAARVR